MKTAKNTFKDWFRIDTGFDGPIHIPLEIFESKNLTEHEVPEDERPIIETAAGALLLCRAAYVKLVVDKIELESEVWATDVLKELLIGLEFLENLVLTLDGGRKQTIVQNIFLPEDH